MIHSYKKLNPFHLVWVYHGNRVWLNLQMSFVLVVGCVTAALTGISIEKYRVKIGRFVLKCNERDVSASEIRLLVLENVERSAADCQPGRQHE